MSARWLKTDLYRTEDNWSDSDSSARLLSDPGHATGIGSYGIPSASTVRAHGRAPSPSFPHDSVSTRSSPSSSIEHFGDFPDVRRAVEEMFRVLRPGGILALATEFRLEGDRIGYPGLLRFDEPELRALLLDGLWWDPATPMKLAVSEETRATAVEMSEAIADQEAGIRGWSRYPHLVLRHEQFLWTSVHVALVKSGLSSAEWRRRAPEMPPTVPVSEKLARRAYPAVAWGRRKLAGGSTRVRDSRSALTIISTSCLEADPRFPAELLVRLGRVGHQLLDLGRPARAPGRCECGPRASGRRARRRSRPGPAPNVRRRCR